MTAMNTHVQNALKNNGGACDSWGLYFDKLSGYDQKNDRILSKVVSQYKKEKSREYLENAIRYKYDYFRKLADKSPNKIKILYFENTSRLIVNMGHSMLIENAGFSFERITGIPNVPGTALKGVVSTWAIWENNADEIIYSSSIEKINTDRRTLNSDLVDIFGANDAEAEQGKINFMGIFPFLVPELTQDILTPHQERINPNQFLCIEKGCKWFCPIMYNRENTEEAAALLGKVEDIIYTCLRTYGVGAKVAAGYGRFEPCGSEDNDLQELCRELEENKTLKELSHTEDGVKRYAEMEDQEFITLVNKYDHSGRTWPGSIQEQYDLFYYCKNEGASRMAGKKQKKALKNLNDRFQGGN